MNEYDLPWLGKELSIEALGIGIELELSPHASDVPAQRELATLGCLRGEGPELVGELCSRVVCGELRTRANDFVQQQVLHLRFRAQAQLAGEQAEGKRRRILP